jgi:signal transduction histidine kinase
VGRGETTSDIPEEGPQDVQRTIRAFNRMRNRLETFVEDRTNLLAAISHDLRSPVTSLRLRAEFIEDEQLRGEILETLSEMQTIIETTLIFARDETRTEESRPTDLAALIESLVSDYQEQGHTCSYSGPERFVITSRPVSLKRAIRNLLENALAYGGSAQATLVPGDPDSGADHRILIEDNGPGIAEADIEHIFEPFVRLETSRSKETGGIGLGLAITRSILRGHGGDVRAENKPDGGLRITASLPQATLD